MMQNRLRKDRILWRGGRSFQNVKTLDRLSQFRKAGRFGLPSVVLLWLSGGWLAFTFFLSLWIWNSEASRPWTSELSDSYRVLRFEILTLGVPGHLDVPTHFWASEFETLTLCVAGHLVPSKHCWVSEFEFLTLCVLGRLNSPIHFRVLRFEILMPEIWGKKIFQKSHVR